MQTTTLGQLGGIPDHVLQVFVTGDSSPVVSLQPEHLAILKELSGNGGEGIPLSQLDGRSELDRIKGCVGFMQQSGLVGVVDSDGNGKMVVLQPRAYELTYSYRDTKPMDYQETGTIRGFWRNDFPLDFYG